MDLKKELPQEVDHKKKLYHITSFSILRNILIQMNRGIPKRKTWANRK